MTERARYPADVTVYPEASDAYETFPGQLVIYGTPESRYVWEVELKAALSPLVGDPVWIHVRTKLGQFGARALCAMASTEEPLSPKTLLSGDSELEIHAIHAIPVEASQIETPEQGGK